VNEQWRERIITDDTAISVILETTSRIAVLGMKTEQQAGEPAFEVPRYMAAHGYEIVPVPVYYPSVESILGHRVYRSVASIPDAVDLVNVFRRSQDVATHVDDILAAAPRYVWMQSGISNDVAAEKFARAGIDVVQNRCLMVEHARWARRRR
jgi:predicted CoA-binding protein